MDRGVVLSEVGRFDLEEIEVDAPGEGEVLVRIEASGVCHSDLHVVETGWAHRFPVLLGHEGAGVVEEVGGGVTTLAPGDRVVLGWRSPCGACRQVLAEFSPELKVVLATTGGLRKTTTLRELLPDAFLPSSLPR